VKTILGWTRIRITFVEYVLGYNISPKEAKDLLLELRCKNRENHD